MTLGTGLRREIGHLGVGLHRVRDGLPAEDLRRLQPSGLGPEDHERGVRAHPGKLFATVQKTR